MNPISFGLLGFLIAVTRMPIPGWVRGALVGLLISIPDAIVTKAYAPILASGIVGGAIIGALSRFVSGDRLPAHNVAQADR
jgi:hypothetical protein